jgi:rRNA maturation RNase YbeY
MRLLVKNWWRPGRRWPIPRRRARELIRRLLEAEGASLRCEISLVFCDDEQIRDLNREYMGEDRPTDVLSFPQGEPAASRGLRPLGDVVISVPAAARQAAAASHPLSAELEWLLLHGTLHLLGHDDATSDGLAGMIRRQRQILAALEGTVLTSETAAPQTAS